MHWLEQLQNSQEAWPVSIDCLSNLAASPPEVVFFAAQTLKHKVVSDLSQLDQQAVLDVFKLLQDLAYRPGVSRPLRTQLLLALAAVYVQTELLLDTGTDERVHAELLSIIPEQLNNRLIHLSEDRLAERKRTLLLNHSSSAIALFLKALDGDDAMKKIGVEGLQNWIHYAELTCEQSVHILQVAVRVLTEESAEHEDLVEGSCEMICELVYQNTKNHPFYASFAHYLPHLCNLLLSTEDGNVKAIGSMLVECSELYLTNLLASPDALTALIPALLKLSSHPDREIVELTFNFWTELEVVLEGGGCPQSTRDAFSPVYANLFGTLLPRVQYPSDSVRLSAEEREAFRDFRHMIGDCLKDCVRVVGSTAAIELLMNALQQAIGANAWQPVEACLFALRTVSSVIDRRESEQLPGLFPVLLSLDSHPKLVYSTLLVIGCLSDWIKYHVESLRPSVEYIARGLTHRGDSSITAASAMAMRYLCESCSNLMVPMVDQLLDLYSNIIRSGEVESKEDQLALTESICHVIVAEGADTAVLLPRAVSWFVEQLSRPGAQGDMDGVLEHLALFVELVVPESVSAVSPAWPMTGVYLDSVEPRIPGLCTALGATIDPGLASLLKAAISKYTRGLGQTWLRSVVQTCQSLFSAGCFPSAPCVLRYAVLLGDCNDSVQQLILKDIGDKFAGYAQQSLDCLTLLVSIYDYWRGIQDEDVVRKAIHLATCVAADPSAPIAELTASIILALRVGVALPALTRPDYAGLLRAILRSALLSFPPQAQPDCATLLHRIGRASSGIVEGLLQDILTTDLPGLVTARERDVWVRQCTDALQESRPKGMKNALSTWAAAVRRRLPRDAPSASSQSGSVGSIH